MDNFIEGSTCFVVSEDGLSELDASSALLLPGQPVQLEDGTTAYIASSGDFDDESLHQIEMENGTTAFIALSHTDSDPLTLDQNCYTETDQEEEAVPSKRKAVSDKKEIISISDNPELSYSFGLEDEQGTFSILQYSAEESNDGQEHSDVKHILLEEDDLSQSSTVHGKAVSKGSVLINPDDPMASGDGLNDENCNDENESVFFNQDSEEDDEDEIDDEDEEDCSSVRLKATSISRKKFVKPGKAKSYSCSVAGCSKTYTAVHHLKVHARTHTGDRPFLCTEPSCDKRFGTNYALKAHIRTHTGEKPYLCPEDNCGKGFKTSGDLQKHIRTHTGERPFKCNVPGCDRSFTTSNIRKVHVRTHTGERPYECTEPGCGRAFASATNFKNHMRIHSGEKPYMCNVKMCGRRFTEYSSLYKHQTVHTQQKPYECRECGRNYRQSSTLTMHRRTAHGIIQATDGSEIVLKFPAPESYMFLELSENDTLVSFNSNQVLESIETSTPSPALPVRADNDSEDEDVMTPTISMDDDDSSLKQIFVVTEEGDITAYDENFDPLESSVV